MTASPVTQAEAEAAFEKCADLHCWECGRIGDWIARSRDGKYIIVDCDSCGISSTRVELAPMPDAEHLRSTARPHARPGPGRTTLVWTECGQEVDSRIVDNEFATCTACNERT